MMLSGYGIARGADPIVRSPDNALSQDGSVGTQSLDSLEMRIRMPASERRCSAEPKQVPRAASARHISGFQAAFTNLTKAASIILASESNSSPHEARVRPSENLRL